MYVYIYIYIYVNDKKINLFFHILHWCYFQNFMQYVMYMILPFYIFIFKLSNLMFSIINFCYKNKYCNKCCIIFNEILKYIIIGY